PAGRVRPQPGPPPVVAPGDRGGQEGQAAGRLSRRRWGPAELRGLTRAGPPPARRPPAGAGTGGTADEPRPEGDGPEHWPLGFPGRDAARLRRVSRLCPNPPVRRRLGAALVVLGRPGGRAAV